MKAIRALLLSAIVSACADSMTAPGPSTPPGPVTATVSYCAGLEPLWVAFQDGDGAWTRALPTVSDGMTAFQFTFASNRSAIATATAGGQGITDLHVLYGSPAELEAEGDVSPRFCTSAATKTLLGTVAGLDTNEIAFIRVAGSAAQAFIVPGNPGDFTLPVVPPGPLDLLATRATHTAGEALITRMLLRRGIDLPDGATLPVLDFRSDEAFAPAVANVSITGADVDGAFSSTRLRTSNLDAQVSLNSVPAGEATRPYTALPLERLLPGDLQVLTASTSGGGTVPGSARGAILYFRAPTDRTLTLGPHIIPPTFSTVATTPYLRLRARFTPQSDYDRATSIAYQEGATTIVAVSMTAAYAGASAAGYELIIPDLSQVAGFDPAWALRPAEELRWGASRIGGTIGLGIAPVVSDGATQRTAFVDGTLTPQ